MDLKGKGPRGSVAKPANESGDVCHSVNVPSGGIANPGGHTTAVGGRANGTPAEAGKASLGFEQEAMMDAERGGVDLRTGYTAKSSAPDNSLESQKNESA